MCLNCKCVDKLMSLLFRSVVCCRSRVLYVCVCVCVWSRQAHECLDYLLKDAADQPALKMLGVHSPQTSEFETKRCFCIFGHSNMQKVLPSNSLHHPANFTLENGREKKKKVFLSKRILYFKGRKFVQYTKYDGII